jgi:hypothetical protein
MKKLLISGIFCLVFLLQSCSSDKYKTLEQNAEFTHAGIKRITEIIRHDIFAPPISARIYAYSSIAGYEALVPGYSNYQSLAGQLNGLEKCPQPETGKEYSFSLASANAQLTVGKALVFSEGEMEDEKEEIFGAFQKMNMPKDVYERSMAFGEAIAKHILAWSKKDHYAQLRSAPKFTITTTDPARWRPTPPMYADALEPHWMEMRPWVLDSASQFRPTPPPPFSSKKGSPFYKLAEDVMNIGKKLNETQTATAWFWDDNPFAMQVSGHFSAAMKKISPGGHWMNITGHACRKAKKSVIESAEAYVYTALALTDGFISCWEEKYRSNVLRPETFINQYIDQEWHPLIQTPPFPEHTSGHSTISMASATVLTSLFGENFAFRDSTEMEFGIPPRDFSSFKQAAEQCGESRVFGGIHYLTGCNSGLQQGKMVGGFVLKSVKTKK